jgi:hypothetical protein
MLSPAHVLCLKSIISRFVIADSSQKNFEFQDCRGVISSENSARSEDATPSGGNINSAPYSAISTPVTIPMEELMLKV